MKNKTESTLLLQHRYMLKQIYSTGHGVATEESCIYLVAAMRPLTTMLIARASMATDAYMVVMAVV